MSERPPQQQPGHPPPASFQAKRRVSKSFDISQLPSLKDGISAEEESTRRRKTCRFLEEAGLRVLKLPRVAVSTSMVFFHRFYAKHSFAEHDRFEVAVACLLLAAKTEESPRKLKDVIQECYKLKNRGAAGRNISRNSNEGASEAIADGGKLDGESEEYLKLKERILLLERVILHTIGFELSVDHPYKFLVEQIKKLVATRQLEYVSPPVSATPAQITSKMMNDMMQYSMNFANDSMHTSLCLQFPARTIASSCVFLGGQFSRVRPVQGKNWIDLLGCTNIDAFSSICVQIMEVIAEKKGAHNDSFQGIRDKLDQLREARV